MTSLSPVLLVTEASSGFLSIATDLNGQPEHTAASELIRSGMVSKVSYAKRANVSPISLRSFTIQSERKGQLAGVFDFNFSSECMKTITLLPHCDVADILSKGCKGFHFATQWVQQQFTENAALHHEPVICHVFFYMTGSGRNEIGALLRHAITGDAISSALAPFYRPTSTELKKKIQHVLTVMRAAYTTAKIVPDSVFLAAEKTNAGEWIFYCDKLKEEMLNT